MVQQADQEAKKAEKEQRNSEIEEQRKWEKKAFDDLLEGKTDFLELVRDPRYPLMSAAERAKLRTFSTAVKKKDKKLIDLFLENLKGDHPFEEIDPADYLLRKWIESTGNKLMLELYDERVICAFFETTLNDALEGKVVLWPFMYKSIKKHSSMLSSLVKKVRLVHPGLENEPAK